MKDPDIESYLTEEFWKNTKLETFSSLPFSSEYLAVPEGGILFQTSGSSGVKKWVIHTRETMLASAKLVVEHLEVTNADIWLLAIPIYHVGGFGILARSYYSGCSVVAFQKKWNVQEAVSLIGTTNVSICSFVPTQLVDIVKSRFQCPETVRIVIVGGGKLDEVIKLKALGLGWPILESYGMTETGSQIATQVDASEEGISLINGWDVKISRDGELLVKGEGLMKGYLMFHDNRLEIIEPFNEKGWFITNDKVEISDDKKRLKFIRRSDRSVKILGELVDLDNLESELNELTGVHILIVEMPEVRRGFSLYPVIEESSIGKLDLSLLKVTGLNSLEKLTVCDSFPRNSMGKLDRSRLRELVVILE